MNWRDGMVGRRQLSMLGQQVDQAMRNQVKVVAEVEVGEAMP